MIVETSGTRQNITVFVALIRYIISSLLRASVCVWLGRNTSWTFCTRIWADPPFISSSRANSSFLFKFRSCVLGHHSYGWQPLSDNWGVRFIWNDGKHLALYTVCNTQYRILNFHLCQCFQSCAVQLILDPLAHHSISQSLKMHCHRKSFCVSVYLLAVDIGVSYTWMEIMLIGVYMTWNILRIRLHSHMLFLNKACFNGR